MNAANEDIFQVQRRLRRQLLEGPGAVRWRPGRELVAQLLLYLDDPQACWRISTEWLRETLDADRVDGGYGGFIDPGGRCRDYVVIAEAQRDVSMLPSALGRRFDGTSPGLVYLWEETGVVPIADVTQERSMPAELRGTVLSMGTAAKLVLPLRNGSVPIGIICADWQVQAPRWANETCNELPWLASQVLGPLLKSASQLASSSELLEPQSQPVRLLRDLTPAELKVARLVTSGLSYKEIALQLDRSLSTVDHQLRSIRDKLGVRSTSRLVHLLSEHWPALQTQNVL